MQGSSRITSSDLLVAAQFASRNDEGRRGRFLEAGRRLGHGFPIKELGLAHVDLAWAQELAPLVEGEPEWNARFERALNDLDEATAPRPST